MGLISALRRFGSAIARRAAKKSTEVAQGLADDHAVARQHELTNRVLVAPRPLLDHRQSAANHAVGFEVAEQEHRVGKIREINRTLHRTDESVLREDHQGDDAELTEIAQEFVHLQHGKPFVGHRIEVSSQAVDDYDACTLVLDALPDNSRELTRREFGWIDLLEPDMSRR